MLLISSRNIFYLNTLDFFTQRRFVSKVVATNLKPATTGYKKSRIADKIRIYVRGGSGGQGCPSTGGIGGKGGSVFIKCLKGASLSPYTLRQNRRLISGHGEHYRKDKFKAKPGKDIYITVPPGTEIKSGYDELITDLDKSNDVIKIANGGAGGSARTSDFNGLKGERKNIMLELKTIADVALTGFPNAGKSSLLRVLSRARPKVGDYPFTTISPMVGSIFYSDNRQITVADLPGLIEDAHLNKGLGHKFLRHIERTRAIVLVVDINGFQLKTNHVFRSPLDTVILLLKELALYKDTLLTRPFFLVLNKMDVGNADEKCKRFFDEIYNLNENHVLLREQSCTDDVMYHLKEFVKNDFENIISVSTVNGHGLSVLKDRIYYSLPIGL